nr:hypothetical protein [Tanacetum cinerariifolium]
MEASVCSSLDALSCPFRGFHCCSDGMARLPPWRRVFVPHWMLCHAHLEAFIVAQMEWRGPRGFLGEALKVLDQWLCGVCMCLRALSRACHHADGITRFKWVAGDVEEFIVGIARPYVRREMVPLGGVVLDDVLLDRVFSLPIMTVKSIPHSCRMAFSHALTTALGKVAATPTSVEAWIKLLLLPRCTLRVFRPSNSQERRSGSWPNLSMCRVLDCTVPSFFYGPHDQGRNLMGTGRGSSPPKFSATSVSPLVGFRENRFVAGQAALKAESSKVAKHEKGCLENQHVFIPFAFDTFGFFAPETEKFLNRVQRVVQSNCSTPKTQNFIFSRIGFAIQKGVAAQLVARLPAILLINVVTGGNKGVGLEICRQLAEQVLVVLTARDERLGADAVAKLHAFLVKKVGNRKALAGFVNIVNNAAESGIIVHENEFRAFKDGAGY